MDPKIVRDIHSEVALGVALLFSLMAWQARTTWSALFCVVGGVLWTVSAVHRQFFKKY